MVSERDGDRTIIRLSGVFDRASACELRDRLEEDASDDLVLDFSLVREFADAGVEALAPELAAHVRRLRLRGLRQHQARMFRYFGVDVDALDGARP
jgi:hypothetical protein